jgi:acid phosphatase (class A)
MYINEVLYHIDEEYRQYCDAIDKICEEILLEDNKKDAWFFDMTPDEQEQYLKDHPNSKKAKELAKKRDAMSDDDHEIPDDEEKPEGEEGEVAPEQEQPELPNTVKDLKQHVRNVIDAVDADIETVAIAFKEPSVYNTVKALGAGITGASRVVMGSLRTIGKSLTVGGAAIHDTDSFQKLEKGIIKVDEFMQKNKPLSKLSAVAVSGLAIGQWLRMSFSGDIESDFDLTIIPQAFAGEAGFRELIATPDGIKGMGLLSAGMATGGLPIWMGGATGLALALTYSGLQSAGQTEAGKVMKERMVKWAEKMGDTVEKGARAVDKAIGLDKNNEPKGVAEMRISNILEMNDMQFAPAIDLKKPKYKKIKVFNDDWSSIKLTEPPKNDSKTTRQEIETIQKEVNGASKELQVEYKMTDKDTSYYIKEYLNEVGLEYSDDVIEYLEEQSTPVTRHYKNRFNRPRPYQIAEKLKIPFKKFKTGTANTPSYPSGHTVQSYVVANYYSEKYPEHKDELRKMADKSAYGRVVAGLHYPSDYRAGIQLADELVKYMNFDEVSEDAPLNSTGSAVSTDIPLMKSRSKYLKKNKEDSKKLFGLLKRYR